MITDAGEDALARTLMVIGQAARAGAAALYRHQAGGLSAQHVAGWRGDVSLPADVAAKLARLDYRIYRDLHDTLSAGLMLERHVSELLPATQVMLGPIGLQHLLCVPLLDGGELVGFIALAYLDAPRRREAGEPRFLATLANYLALALVRHEAESRLRVNAQRLSTLVGATEDMVFELDGGGMVINVWSSHPALPSASLVGLPLDRAFPQDMAWALRQAMPRALASDGREQFEFTLPRLEGAIYCIGRLQAVPSENGNGRHLVALVRDVTELMREEARRRSMVETLDLLEEAVIELSADGRLSRVSAAWSQLRGGDESDPQSLGQPLSEFVHPDDHATLVRAYGEVLRSGEPVTVRFRLVRAVGEPVWLEAKLLPNWGADGLAQGLRGVLRDVTAAHLSEAHIRQLALYDGLTGLPNRVLLDDLLNQALARARRHGSRVALGFIDLDHFKQINDAFGHQAGDQVLATLARQIRSVLREEDVLARWGGDEFIVMLPDLPDLATLSNVAERLREIARQGVVLEGIETRPTISIGMAVYPDNADNAESLLRAADSTMYHAKAMGRNNVQFYGDIVHLKSIGREHMAIQTRLNHAVLGNELQVFYQPIVNARTGEVSSVEALARWHDDVAGWITPQLFIPMAEKLGLISELSEQITVQALTKLKGWRERGLKQQLALNVSRNLLFSPRFVKNLIATVEEYGLRPADVMIEVTESLALTDHARQSRHLRQLHEAGFRIAIDDFGTGYSSLSQLHDMPVDVLKVDLSFTARLNQEAGRRIMQAIVQMAHSLGMEVVVEGVETLDAARFLQGLGVEKMQGFHFSEPVPAGVCELHMQLGLDGKI
ncbi:bifunctional diguanylate cyclase/phosphodiesterase [Chitinimonas koreensis]|uniref:bifunctional diguanylate cyclase/phosphodiesterase n=1 Tax=Chitinimonas koreensis TaxID=356302 RepID=UPI001654A51F|nr:EAL domain-containing protein [Chitinimonas koreensis]QNM96872.1 EAL domain-containing protein [Chitinimonas koreensis]